MSYLKMNSKTTNGISNLGGGKGLNCVKSNENLGIQDVFVSCFVPVINWMEVVKLYEKAEITQVH